MNQMLVFSIVVNVVVIMIWFGIYKLRTSKSSFMKEWDNGNEFYESLPDDVKEQYWKEDTSIVNKFFMMLLVVCEATLLLLNVQSKYWLMVLLVGLFLSCLIGILMSLNLKKTIRKAHN